MRSLTYTAEGHRPAWLTLVLGRLRAYWVLVKDLQTGLLIVTAAAGFASGCCANSGTPTLLGMLGSLFFAVGGCTILNMAFDRDIDARMQRTAKRPLPAGKILPAEAWTLGGLMTAGGLVWALIINPLYALMVLIGVALNALVYTVWLKRRTPYAILIGGLAGGMPALSGRVLATGQVDWTGVLLALGVLLWIPTHIMTFTIKYQEDYARAGLPTFPAVYGVRVTRLIIAVSSVLVALVLLITGWLIGVPAGIFIGLAVLGVALLGLTALAMVHPTQALNFSLYKGASIYMLLAMILFIVSGN